VSSADRAIFHNQFHASHGSQATAAPVHSVHFYEDDGLFLDSLSEFVGAALGAGGACLVIATQSHRAGLNERLKSHGIDTAYTTALNRLVSIEASEMLARFMVNGHPDEARFYEAVEPELHKARKALRGRSTSVVAFGEMVSILWHEGNYDAAIKLEELWDRMAHRYGFSLRCAYPIGLFSDQAQYDLFRRVCAAHYQVIPSDSYPALDDENDRHRMISSLQQKAWTMQAVMKGREDEIARLKHIEARLQRSEEFAKNVVECSVDCIKVLDLDGRIQYMSPPGLQTLEIAEPDSLLGRRWVDFWDVEDRRRAEAAVDVAVTGGVGSFTGECTTPGGTRKWWDVKITPAFDADGQVERLIAISHDITELRIAQQAAIESERQAIAGRMAATIAHEINNPLEAVTNYIYLASASECLPEGAAEYLRQADHELARAGQITRRMLSFYRDSSKTRWVSITELMQEVVALFSRKLLNKQLTTSIVADPALEVYAKDGELRQVLLNLTANAVDACHPGGKIQLRAHSTANWKGRGHGVRITIADNGMGMSPATQRRIFVPFFTTKGGGGNGIGLWITRCLVEQQGGYVHFRSSQGDQHGTVMSLFLPGARAATEEIADVA
jgi:PAS domain S-box-containing protein